MLAFVKFFLFSFFFLQGFTLQQTSIEVGGSLACWDFTPFVQ